MVSDFWDFITHNFNHLQDVSDFQKFYCYLLLRCLGGDLDLLKKVLLGKIQDDSGDHSIVKVFLPVSKIDMFWKTLILFRSLTKVSLALIDGDSRVACWRFMPLAFFPGVHHDQCISPYYHECYVPPNYDEITGLPTREYFDLLTNRNSTIVYTKSDRLWQLRGKENDKGLLKVLIDHVEDLKKNDYKQHLWEVVYSWICNETNLKILSFDNLVYNGSLLFRLKEHSDFY